MRDWLSRFGKAEPFAGKCPRVLVELEACSGEGERLMGVVRERLSLISTGRDS